MLPTVGEIFEGKVTGITKFGAFVSLPGTGNGLVHISEIANTYVTEVSDHIAEGQTVKVKVIGINDGGKVSLSIKKAEAPKQQDAAGPPNPGRPPQRSNNTPPPMRAAAPPTANESFENKLKQFMHDADNRISDSRRYTDKKGSSRRKRD